MNAQEYIWIVSLPFAYANSCLRTDFQAPRLGFPSIRHVSACTMRSVFQSSLATVDNHVQIKLRWAGSFILRLCAFCSVK